MKTKMEGLKKVSHFWWLDSHNSAKRSSLLQLTLSELQKKTKCILNLIEGDADSFAKRAEMYYRKRPELVNMIEDFYRSYRYLVGQCELHRSEAGACRIKLQKSGSFNQSYSQKSLDSTELYEYPESEVSEVGNSELEEADRIKSILIAANEEYEVIRRNLEIKSPVQPLILNSFAAANEVNAKVNLSVKSYKSKWFSYFFGNKQMETNDHESKHQYEIKLIEVPFRKEIAQNMVKPMNKGLEVCSRNTGSLSIYPVNFVNSKECDKYCHYESQETIPELDDCKDNDLETKVLFENIIDNVAMLTSEVDSLKMEKETFIAELERKDEEKRHVIRQLSLTVEILKDENVILKKIIKDSKKN